jgi:hypothetical protein
MEALDGCQVHNPLTNLGRSDERIVRRLAQERGLGSTYFIATLRTIFRESLLARWDCIKPPSLQGGVGVGRFSPPPG